jgi:hypothetical protein
LYILNHVYQRDRKPRTWIILISAVRHAEKEEEFTT